MHGRQRHLRGPDQEQVVFRQGIHLLVVVGEEARAEQSVLPNQHRRDDRREAVRAQHIEGIPDQSELDHHGRAGEIAEARPADLGRPLDVDHGVFLAEVSMVAHLVVTLGHAAPRLQLDGVLFVMAVGSALVRQVGDLDPMGVELGVELVGPGQSRLVRAGQLSCPGDRRLLLVTLEPGDLLTRPFLL